jgi:hypothetical protein
MSIPEKLRKRKQEWMFNISARFDNLQYENTILWEEHAACQEELEFFKELLTQHSGCGHERINHWLQHEQVNRRMNNDSGGPQYHSEQSISCEGVNQIPMIQRQIELIKAILDLDSEKRLEMLSAPQLPTAQPPFDFYSNLLQSSPSDPRSFEFCSALFDSPQPLQPSSLTPSYSTSVRTFFDCTPFDFFLQNCISYLDECLLIGWIEEVG